VVIRTYQRISECIRAGCGGENSGNSNGGGPEKTHPHCVHNSFSQSNFSHLKAPSILDPP
jgi:hypothetical protein